ncbi:DUF4276 family protein [Parabacteroides sp. ZJ-118]|uniref:DUF4276 family protein n=1 Tax=Parabacteroides sp. ZJ-118 TaxID=2709398 RepID=UPI0013EDAFA8|nr:DUF4276 family protein [Parabacteroides sp. ZJ-118]
MVRKTLYVEGSPNLENGDLRKAFNTLLAKELEGNMPRIVMGKGKQQTVDKFLTTPMDNNEVRFLLVDSDSEMPVKNERKEYGEFNASKPNRVTNSVSANTFFMIQEAEAWILSQPDVLKKEGLKNLSYNRTDLTRIPNPSDLVGRIYKDNGRNYHKVRDFTCLFPLLDTGKLKSTFTDFADLIEALKQ